MVPSGDLSSRWLSAQEGDLRTFSLVVFVPSRTRDGKELDHDYWCHEALQEMARLFGGATALAGVGAWRDDERDAAIKQEGVSIVVSLMAEEEWNEENVVALGTFLKRMGRETAQGEVGIVVQGRYFPIRSFDT